MKRSVTTRKNSVSDYWIDDNDILSLIRTLKAGIKYAVFIGIANNSPFTLSEWTDFLHLSDRTMQRYKSQKKTFDPVQSEKILEIALLYKLGIDVFGNKQKFNSWLETDNLALGRAKPKSLLDNSFGIGLLHDELMRIEHGVLA
jgi:putative toxin-antitoxin system antitoxin component (TIGR02293 family)